MRGEWWWGADALRGAVMQPWAGFLGWATLRVGWLAVLGGGGSISIFLGFFAAVGGVFVLGVAGRWAIALYFLNFLGCFLNFLGS